ncbi:WhiB family transcriptional regulator [Mycobacterium sp. ITM-2016-00316]|uniref:WhiB family transcriptional regulator n=1 Tax=Mycobacterium sp. ITM-2016-00316 TaxID=2099695 RepID=UPI000CF98E2A|nr:WhiB family transcriptional regulator [Mycobacterium sp. ITM-2016-00316]WNG79512.1 WhiB family transcriptional regulator [Mycobacterium sp. ITM-2016-00316]
MKSHALKPMWQQWAWQFRAECSGCSAEVFFPSEVDQENPRRRAANARAAKLICQRCPVVRQCLHHALTVPERFGVWGGLTPQERLRIAP